MKIYKLEHDAENYRWLEYRGDWFDFFHGLIVNARPIHHFDGRIECRAIRDKKGRTLGDYPVFSVPAISARAKDVLGEYFGGLVEMFPLETGRLGAYYFMNMVNVLDCLDEEKSDLAYFSDGHGVMLVRRPVFKADLLTPENSKIFVLRQKPGGDIYVNQDTKSLIESAALEGFRFAEI